MGQVSLAVQNEHGPALRQVGASVEATFILGGQIAGQAPGLYLIYPQGNWMTATPETPYLQIGESEYGDPALDHIVHPGLSLDDGARVCLVSPGGHGTLQSHGGAALRGSPLSSGPVRPLPAAQAGGRLR